MKNTAVKVLLIMTIISSVFLCGLLFLLVNKGKGDKESGSRLKEYQDQYDARVTDSKILAPKVYEDFSKLSDGEGLYDTARHTQVYERIEALKKTGSYTEDEPLVIYNPYGINTRSLYVYFKTGKPMKMSYRISAQGSEISTFSADCYSEEKYTTTHEYILLGLNAEDGNRVALTLTDAEGASCVRTFYVAAAESPNVVKSKLDMRRGISGEKLSDGLFAHFGNETGGQETVTLYDNDGMLRGEILLLSGSCKRFLFFGERMYYNISDTQIAAVDRFGRAERVYAIDGYTIGNDYCIDEGKKKLLVLASKNGEKEKGVNDRVLSVDLISGEVKELLNMGEHLKEYKAVCRKNIEDTLEWLNLNSIQVMGENDILLGAREASAVFKIKDVYGVPMLDYIVGEPLIFAGTGYEYQLLAKEGTFASFFGANTVTYRKEEGMPLGMYLIDLYDNHIGGTDSRPGLDYSEMASDLGTSLKSGTSSYFCTYLVNEANGTWSLQESVPVAYSGYAGSAQLTPSGHLITDTAGRFSYSEFDSNRELICSYTGAGKDYLARVFKYDFKKFYFAGQESEIPADAVEAE